MRFFNSIFRTLLSIALFFAVQTLAAASTGEGVKAFRNGDYQKAAEEFANAEQKSPDDLRIIFNHGAALAASGKLDEAIQALRKSAVAKDKNIASKSLVLLGGLAVERAKQILPEKPEETPSEQRQHVLDQLLAAEKYYTESLIVEPSETVRMNLEQIRAWKNKIQTEWDSVDRSKKRSDDIAQRLQWFEDWEGTINNTIRQINEIPDSPKKFQTLYETARNQNKLTDEISVLRNEFQQTLQQKPDGKEISEQERQGAESVLQELEQIQNLAGNVGESLRQFQSEKALDVARETTNRMNRLRLNLSPFEAIVQEAEKKQATLCNNNPANVNKPTETEPTKISDLSEQSREEQLIADWTPLMAFRAKQGLQNIESGHLNNPNQPVDAIRESMNLAVQYAPEIQTITEEASRLLAENQSEEALPKQNQALERLREILKPLQQNPQNQQNQNQQQNQQQQQQNQQQQQDGQQNNQEQEQKQEKNQEQKQEQEQQQNQEQKQKEQEKKTDKSAESNASETKPEQQKDDLTSQKKDAETEKAERMLRQVKRRQQEANERREKIRALLMQTAPVEKDW
jgi:hypothetical protein